MRIVKVNRLEFVCLHNLLGGPSFARINYILHQRELSDRNWLGKQCVPNK
jgi:hypothetical protein